METYKRRHDETIRASHRCEGVTKSRRSQENQKVENSYIKTDEEQEDVFEKLDDITIFPLVPKEIAHVVPEEIKVPTLENFRVLALLGKGDVGNVYLVKGIGLGDKDGMYAMKVIEKEDIVHRNKVQV